MFQLIQDYFNEHCEESTTVWTVEGSILHFGNSPEGFRLWDMIGLKPPTTRI